MAVRIFRGFGWAGVLLLAAVPRGDADGPGRVVVEICEKGISEKEEWPAASPVGDERYEAPAFGFFHVPFRYIETGIRADRANPYLLRASAEVSWPAGKHRILLRARGATRLWVDGQLLLTTPFVPKISDGHSPIPTDYLDLGPDFRFKPPGNREKWTTFTSKGGKHRIVLESIVGGKRGAGIMRQDLGETVAAISFAGRTASETFHLIAPESVVPYTDAGWKVYEAGEWTRLRGIEADRREAALKQHAAEWIQRRNDAKAWLASSPEIPVPAVGKGYPVHNAIDHFLADRIEAAFRAGDTFQGTIDYTTQIQPILKARCFSCHQGERVKGKLRLDQRESALKGGVSGKAAFAPGHPDKSEAIARLLTTDADEKMPPQGLGLTPDELTLLKDWIKEGARFDSLGIKRRPIPGLAEDLTFLRRVTLDTVGVVPTSTEIDAFLADKRPDRRARAIDRLLADRRWADHWVGYWQDVLAENPNILNPTLNNTGPFRWWLYEALYDNKPMDLFVTELVRMRGSAYHGAPAGFALATQNDAPLAEKAVILASAFLGVQMKCARCHDAPGHKSTQKDLFSIAAMLNEAPLAVPATSTVPVDKIHEKGRKPLITVSIKPGTKIAPAYPWAEGKAKEPSAPLAKGDAGKIRDDLAARITAPSNERFAQVLANRLWKRLMGRGLVEPVDDWERGEPTHPELLRYLGRELVRGGYDLKQLARLILNSHAYQRASDPALKETDPFYIAHAPRRLSAEQIVDSLFSSVGLPMKTEEISLDIDGGRDVKNSLSLGKPTRAWMLASTSNERDRPSLSLPRVQAMNDLLEAFGWRPTRQAPTTDRELAPNVLQPAILANGMVGTWLTRLSDEHGVTQLAIESQTPEDLVDRLFLRVLTRRPTADEKASLAEHLRPGFSERIVKNPPAPVSVKRVPPKYVSWSNHLTEEANQIKIELEAAARRGDPPTPRLTATWRERMEDVLWATLNSPELVFTR